MSTAALSAPRRQPPLQLFNSDLFTVVCARASAHEDASKLNLTIESTLRGIAREHIVLRVPEGLLAELDAEASYLFVYGDLERNPRKPGVYTQLEEGTLAAADGAEPAVFCDCERSARWFAPAQAALERDPAYLKTILTGVASDDRHEQNLWLAELLLRPDLAPRLSQAQRDEVFSITLDPDAIPSARARLLQAALDGVLAVPRARLLDAARQIVAQTQVEQSPALHNPEEPVLLALHTLAENPADLAPKIIERWLRSPRPALAEQAALALRAISPEQEIRAVEAALAGTLLPAQTRVFLRDHLRRARLITDAARS